MEGPKIENEKTLLKMSKQHTFSPCSAPYPLYPSIVDNACDL